MEYISFDDFKKMDIYNDFMRVNPSIGYLKIRVSNVYEAIPLNNVLITIYKDIGEFNVIFYQGITDSNGIISNIKLPCPKGIDFIEIPEYSIYLYKAEKDGYEVDNNSFVVFSDVVVNQSINLEPIIEKTN